MEEEEKGKGGRKVKRGKGGDNIGWKKDTSKRKTHEIEIKKDKNRCVCLQVPKTLHLRNTPRAESDFCSELNSFLFLRLKG